MPYSDFFISQTYSIYNSIEMVQASTRGTTDIPK